MGIEQHLTPQGIALVSNDNNWSKSIPKKCIKCGHGWDIEKPFIMLREIGDISYYMALHTDCAISYLVEGVYSVYELDRFTEMVANDEVNAQNFPLL